MRKHNFYKIIVLLFIVVLAGCKSLPTGTTVKAVDLLDNSSSFYLSIPTSVDPDLLRTLIKENVDGVSASDIKQIISRVNRAYVGLNPEKKNSEIQLSVEANVPRKFIPKILTKKSGWQSVKYSPDNSKEEYSVYSRDAVTMSFPSDSIALLGRDVVKMLNSYDSIAATPFEESVGVNYSPLSEDIYEYISGSDQEIRFMTKNPQTFLLMLTGQRLNLQLNDVKGSFILDPNNPNQYLLDFYLNFKNQTFAKAGRTLLSFALGLTDFEYNSENMSQVIIKNIKINKNQLYEILQL